MRTVENCNRMKNPYTPKGSAMFQHKFFPRLSASKKCVALCFVSTVCFLIALPAYAAAANVGTLYAFGDSGIDTGNAYYFSGGTTPDAALGYWQGRFCDGPNYLDQLAGNYSEWGSTAASYQGTNWAFGGAESGPGYSAKYGVPNLQEQLVLFKADKPGFAFSEQDVVLISTGHNDVLSHPASPPETSTIVQYVMESVAALQAMGARIFIIPTTVAVHLCPGVTDSGTEAVALAREWLVAFNSGVDTALAALKKTNPELTIVRTDIFSNLEYVYAHPTEYGLTNVTDESYNGEGTPASYLWFDNAHVTSHVSESIAQWILADFRLNSATALSQAQCLLLFGLLLGLGVAVKSRRAG